MPEPAIKNWRNFPPAGGWNVSYSLQGQSFTFTGSPKKIVEQVRKVQVSNGIYQNDTAIWGFLNGIWCERDPKRCIRSMARSASPARKTQSVRRASGGCCGGGSVR